MSVDLERLRRCVLSYQEAAELADELQRYRSLLSPSNVEIRDDESKEETAPYQVVVSFCRTSGTSRQLFESKIKHCHTISLEISVARVITSKEGHRFISDGRELIRLEMSEMQYAQMITSMNQGVGSPATLVRFLGESIDPPPVPESDSEEHKQQIRYSVKKNTDAVMEAVKSLKALSESGKVSIKQLKSLVRDLEIVTGNLPGNLAYIETQLQERMEERVVQAQAEVNAHVNTVVANLGLKSLDQLRIAADSDSDSE